MIAIQVIPDRFRDIQDSSSKKEASSSSKRTVRRPTRGTALKEDTYATLRVVTGKGENISLIDAAGNDGVPTKRTSQVYSNFLLQSVTEERMEKQQILETFGEPYIFFFGERPRMLTFSGVLLNTFDFNWEAEWWDNYEKYLRGTRCVENDSGVFLSYDENLVSGYILNAAASKNAQERNYVNFQFSMFLTGYTNFSAIGDGTAIPLAARANAKRREAMGLDFQSDPTGKPYVESIVYEVSGPKKLTPGMVMTGALTGMEVKPKSLAEGLEQGLPAITAAWNSAKSITAASAVQQLSTIANGEALRVPNGFTGVFAEDPVDIKRASLGNDYGVVRYTEFHDNSDEFVGSSTHYGNPLLPALLAAGQGVGLTQEFVNECRDEWFGYGFDIPVDMLGELSATLLQQTVGLFGAGNTEIWQVAEAVDQGLSVLDMNPAQAVRAIKDATTPE